MLCANLDPCELRLLLQICFANPSKSVWAHRAGSHGVLIKLCMLLRCSPTRGISDLI